MSKGSPITSSKTLDEYLAYDHTPPSVIPGAHSVKANAEAIEAQLRAALDQATCELDEAARDITNLRGKLEAMTRRAHAMEQSWRRACSRSAELNAALHETA